MKRRCSLRLDLLSIESNFTWQVFDRLNGINGGIARSISIRKPSDSGKIFESFNNIVVKLSNNSNIHTSLISLRAWGKKTCEEIFPDEIHNKLSLYDCGDILFMVPLDWADFPFELLYLQNRFLGQKYHIGTIINTGLPQWSEKQYNQNGDLMIIEDSSEKLQSVCNEGENLKTIAVKRKRQVKLVMQADNYKLNSEIPGASIVHFAGHSGPDQYHDKAGWRLGNRHYFDTDDINKLGISNVLPWLVFSNSCNGGRFSVNPGLSGIAGAFLAAGIHQVVGPICKLNDMQAKCCTLQFYKGLLKGKCAAQALTTLRKKSSQEAGLTPLFYRLFGDPRYREHIKKKLWQKVIFFSAITSIALTTLTVMLNLLLAKINVNNTTITDVKDNISTGKPGGITLDLTVGRVIHFSVNLYAPTFVYKETTINEDTGQKLFDSIIINDTTRPSLNKHP